MSDGASAKKGTGSGLENEAGRSARGSPSTGAARVAAGAPASDLLFAVRSVVEAAFESAALLDDGGCVLYTNNRFLELVGREKEDVVGFPLRQWVGGESPSASDSAACSGYASIRAKKQVVMVEWRLQRRILPGVHLWLARETGAGRWDETAQVQADERLRVGFEVGRVGNWEWKIRTGEVVWSEQLERLHGLDPGAFGGRIEDFWSDIHPEDRDRVLQAVQSSIREKRDHHIQYRIVCPDGSVRWMEGRGRPLPGADGELERMVGVCMDISARKEAELRLLDEQHTLKTLNKINAAIAAELDLERLVQVVTDEGREVTGAEVAAFFYNVRDDIGDCYLLSTVSGQPREAFERFSMAREIPLFAQTFEGGSIVRLSDVRKESGNRQDKGYFGLAASDLPVRSYMAAPVISRSGEVIGGLFFGHSQAGAFSERSERILAGLATQAAIAIDNARLYSDLRRSAAELEQNVQERTVRLRETIRSLEAVCYNIAHDLRAPLRAMQGLTTMLLEDYAAVFDEEGREYARRIVTAAGRMDELIQDLLTYGRLSHVDLHLETVNVPEQVEVVLSQLKEEIRSKRAAVRCEGEFHPVEANATLVVQMLCNLITNGIKFVQRGVPPVIVIRGLFKSGRMSVGVQDNGIGIAAGHRERIFRLFERLHGGEEFPGTGIGLAIVQKAAERMGAKVRVESEEGKGSTFWIDFLPAGAAVVESRLSGGDERKVTEGT